MYFGIGVSPSSVSLLRNSSYEPSYKKRKVLPREVVLSITSATNESSSPKYNLFPILILRAGSTKTSQRRCSAFSSLSKNTYILAGKTLVLLRIITSPSSK
jgi:hypothetical protein